MKQVLKFVHQMHTLYASTIFINSHSDAADSTRTLLGLYEFEAHLWLSHHGNLQAILDSVSSQPHVELKTLEIMAGTVYIIYLMVTNFYFKQIIYEIK